MCRNARSNRVKLATTALLLAVHGCSTIDGGAVELSWTLRPASSSDPDKFVDCESLKVGTGAVTRIRLDWTNDADSDHEEWSCGDSHGVTGFSLLPGATLFSVSPVCAGKYADPKSYIAPAIEERDVKVGDTVSLGAIELVVNVSYCGDQPCICQ